HLHELLEHDPLVEEAAKREVEAGTVWIDMGEGAGAGSPAAGYLPDSIVGDLCDLGVEIAETLPCHRGLERRGKDSARDGVLAVMGRANELVAPGAGRTGAVRILVVERRGVRDTAALPADLQRAFHPGLERMVGRLEGQ